ncbi:MAG: HEPN domain-containing protein [Candidatus Woesearchaeota archaeon]
MDFQNYNTYEWVIIMSYYAMFHSVNALLRKIGVKVGKEYSHEITTNLLLYYLYYTKIIEDELLRIYENAEEKAKGLVVSYIFAKEERTKYQYEVNLESQKKDAENVLEDAVNFVSRLKDISKTLSKELVLAKLNKKTL